MADKLRRTRDLVRKTSDRYLETVTGKYSEWLDGSPTTIIYYRLDDVATKQDSSLENVHSLTGANSPNKYQKINEVTVWGVEMMEVMNEINEKGLQSLVNGELIIRPDTIKPYPGDFFVFDYPGLEEHLFRIDDVQFDRATPKKFYRVGYNLYPNNADEIFGNVIEEYVLNHEGIGGAEMSVITKANSETAERTKDLVDAMLDRYTTLFYDVDMDMFIHETVNHETSDPFYIWSPYLQKFMHNNKIMNKYNPELLTEFYIVDLDQKTNDFFNNLGYRNSIFKKVENQDNRLTLQNSLMGVITNYDINQIRNLPFGYTSGEYRFVDVEHGLEFYFDAFHILEQEYYERFDTLDDKYKFVDNSELIVKERNYSVGDIVYRVSPTSRIIPEDVFKITNITETTINATAMTAGEIYEIVSVGDTPWTSFGAVTGISGEVFTATGPATGSGTVKERSYTYFGISFSSLVQDLAGTDTYLADHYLFSIIRDHLNGDLSLDDTLLTNLNDHYFDITFEDYIMMPMVIFVLKQLIHDALT